MRGVLHVVRKRDDLAIIVVARCEKLRQRRAEQAGRPGPEDDERLAGPAVGTVPAHLRPLSSVPALGHHESRAKDAHQPILAATGTLRRIAFRQVAATPTELRLDTPRGRRRLLVLGQRKEHVDIHIAAKETVVEDAEVPLDVVFGRLFDATPAGRMALAALHQRQVQDVFVALQIVGVAQVVVRRVELRGSFVGRGLGRFVVDAAHHAPQFPQPQVELHVQQWTRRQIRGCGFARLFARDADQRAHRVQDVKRFPAISDRQTALQAFEHGAERRRFRIADHAQQVHERRVFA